MVNTQALKEAIETSGVKYGYIAERLGINPNTLRRKINGESDFYVDEMLRLCGLIGIDNDNRINAIFFN